MFGIQKIAGTHFGPYNKDPVLYVGIVAGCLISAAPMLLNRLNLDPRLRSIQNHKPENPVRQPRHRGVGSTSWTLPLLLVNLLRNLKQVELHVMETAHGPLSSSFLWFKFRMLQGNPTKELLRGPVGDELLEMSLSGVSLM